MDVQPTLVVLISIVWPKFEVLVKINGVLVQIFGIGFGVKLAVGGVPTLIKLPACGWGAVHGLVVITDGRKTLL